MNEHVRTRVDLSRDAPEDTTLALAFFAAISRTNPRVVRDYIHIKVSPGGTTLDDGQIARVIELIEREHHIPATTPRHVTEHGRGRRADHFHLVYPVVDPATGAAIRSNDNFLADEIASRRAEIMLGEPIIAGPRQQEVVREMLRRGLVAEAGVLAAHAPIRSGDRVGDRTRQQAAGRGGDADLLMTMIFDGWSRARGDLEAFRREVASAGLSIVRGDRATLVMGPSGIHVPLARALRQKGKAAGMPNAIRERDLIALADGAPSVSEARERGFRQDEEQATNAVQDELARMAAEAELDGQRELAQRLRIVQEHHRRLRQQAVKRSAAARRRAIRDDLARRDRVRRARVQRAFLLAGLMDRRDLREAVFAIAVGGVVLAGGGLGLALIVAGAALAALPTRERARAAALDARLSRRADRSEQDDALARAYQEAAAEHGRGAAAAKLRFSAVPKHLRGMAGYYAKRVLDRSDGDRPTDEVMSAVARVLGALAPAIEATVLEGAGRSGLAVLRWYDPADPRHRGAVAATLERSGERAAAARLEPSKRQTRQRGGRER